MKKIKIINSVLLTSLGLTIPSMVLTSCSQQDRIQLVKGEKEVYYTNKTKSVVLLFQAKDIKDINKLKVKVVDLFITGASANPVDGLIKYRVDSGGNIAVWIYPQVFLTQWPNAGTIEFGLQFTNKETLLNQTITGIKLTPVDVSGSYDLEQDEFDVMASPEHSVSAGNVYTYTCKFPEGISEESIYKYFSFLTSEDEYAAIERINITKDGEALTDDKFTLKDDNTYIELTDTPKAGEEYIFEIQYLNDGTGRFLNAARNSSLKMEGTVVKGFKSTATEAYINEEFATPTIAFYPRTTAIDVNAFNQKTATIKIPSGYTTISLEKCKACSSINESAFAETTLEKITFYEPTKATEGLKTIGNLAFAYSQLNGCTNYEAEDGELWLPQGLEKIGSGAFNNCNNITKIDLPNTITSIGNGAFSYMPKLKTIWLNSYSSIPAEFENATSIFYNSGNDTGGKGIVYVQFGTKTAWETWLKKQDLNPDYWEISEIK